jgi:RNA polymerase sigma factor (sigma-70 family)
MTADPEPDDRAPSEIELDDLGLADRADELTTRLWREAQRPPVPEGATESFVLLRRHQRGEDRAGDDLVRHYQDALKRYVRVVLGARLRRAHESVDVVQDVFLSALPKLADFDYRGPGSVFRYLKTVARHRVANLGERERLPRTDGDPTTDPFWLGREQTTEGSGLEELLRSELHAVLDEAASRLNERDREIIALRHHFGADWEEIQSALDLPTRAATYMVYQRARTRWLENTGTRLRDWVTDR